MNKERFQSRKGKPNDYSKWIKRGSNREKEKPNDYSKWIKRGFNREKENPTFIPIE